MIEAIRVVPSYQSTVLAFLSRLENEELLTAAKMKCLGRDLMTGGKADLGALLMGETDDAKQARTDFAYYLAFRKWDASRIAELFGNRYEVVDIEAEIALRGWRKK